MPAIRSIGWRSTSICKNMLRGELPELTCLVGTVAQEVYETHPAIRACCASISDHARTLMSGTEAAMRQRGIQDDWTAEGLAFSMQAVQQGAFILAKARNDACPAFDTVDHLRRRIESLFKQD